MSAEINNLGVIVSDLNQSGNESQAEIDACIPHDRQTTQAASTLQSESVSTTKSTQATGAERSPTADRSAPAQSDSVRGFQHSFQSRPTWPPVGADGPGFSEPKPLPHRPKGRFIIGATLFTICAFIASALWDTFLGVSAYGLVEFDTLEVCAPWEGTIAEYHVTEGQRVRRGQLLASIKSLDLVRQLQRLQDELNVAKATLDATASKLEWETHSRAAEYFELWGSFLKQCEELRRIDRDLVRARKVAHVIAEQEIDHLELAATGQRVMLEKMAQALRELRARSTGRGDAQSSDDIGLDQLRPAECRVEYLFGEIHRMEQKLEEGTLLSPVDGIVVRRSRSQGQQLGQSDPILEIVDRSSARIVLYLQQDASRSLPAGTEIELKLDSMDTSIQATVTTTRERFESAPSQIKRYYLSGEPLLPMIVTPRNLGQIEHLKDGAVVKLTLFSNLLSTETPMDRQRQNNRTAISVIDFYSE